MDIIEEPVIEGFQRINAKLPVALWEELAHLAVDRRTTMQALCLDAITEYLRLADLAQAK